MRLVGDKCIYTDLWNVYSHVQLFTVTVSWCSVIRLQAAFDVKSDSTSTVNRIFVEESAAIYVVF